MPLTDRSILATKPKAKPYRLFDRDGLYLEVSPSGGRLWRWKYRIAGKEKRLAVGRYPSVTLLAAREAATEAGRQLRAGSDPGQLLRARKTARGLPADSYEAVAREWFALKSPGWAETNRPRILSRLERDLFPVLGRHPISEVDAPLMLTALRRVESRGAVDTAHRIQSYLGQIGRYAVATGRMTRDPSADLRGALGPVNGGHMAAVTDPEALGAMLRLTDSYPGGFVVASALRLAPRLFVRPGELRTALWADVNLDAGVWSFITSKTKLPLVVPLATQCVSILRDLHGLTGRGRYVFPSARGTRRPMSENAILVALRSMDIGKDVTSGHGFRATARTILDEVLGFPPEIIEAQLGHKVFGPLGRAYNRTAYLPQRVAMMQRWSDYLDEIKAVRDAV